MLKDLNLALYNRLMYQAEPTLRPADDGPEGGGPQEDPQQAPLQVTEKGIISPALLVN